MFAIGTAEELVTSREQTRSGFISFALEKSRRATPLIEKAKSFKALASRARTAKELLDIREIRPAMLSAAGLSDKALKYFSEQDKNEAISNLVENILEPAGEHFVDEVVYRYLLVSGDSLGGSMRNIIGALAQQRLIRTLLSNLSVCGRDYRWFNGKCWGNRPDNDYRMEEKLKAIMWANSKGEKRVFAFNLNVPIVNKNIDLCLFDTDIHGYNNGNIVSLPEKTLMLGELKGGIDPAGADEHWKTGNTALSRIRNAFNSRELKIETSFIAAAIEKNMAEEIFGQLQRGVLSYAANLTVDSQTINYCNWLLEL